MRSGSFWLAIRSESFVESDRALRSMPGERESEEDLRRHALKPKSRYVPEPEFPVVSRMSHETTSLRLHRSQPRQSFLDQGLAEALPLVRRQHRNRSKSIPVWSAIRNGHRREGDMPYHPALHFCDERYRECLGAAMMNCSV